MNVPSRLRPDQMVPALHTLLSHIPDIFCLIFDADYRYLDAHGGGLSRGPNPITREALVGRTLHEAFPPELAALLDPLYAAALRGETSKLDLPMLGLIYEIEIMPLHDESGVISAGMVIVREVTDIRQTGERARRLEAIVENSADAMIMYDLQGVTTYANPAAAVLYHVASPSDLVGRPGLWSLPPDEVERVAQETAASMAASGTWRGQVWNQLPDGKRLLISATSFMLYDSTGAPTASATIARDVTEEFRAAEEQAETQQRIIDAQQATLIELSTPLIPLADGVVVMPIIGTIDSYRAGQIMETLLEGVAANQADIALLDISGVRVVDTRVADGLLRAAKAAKLLGTQIVLTGIKAEVAQTMVHLGADMTEIITRSNLQEGLRYALESIGSNLMMTNQR